MSKIKEIETKVSQVSPELLGELDNYLDYLINKKAVQKSIRLRLDWGGGLKDIKMTSIELQKKALDMRECNNMHENLEGS